MAAAFILLVIWALAGCTGGEAPDTSDILRISVEEVEAKLDAGDNIVIIDTRSTEEYEEGAIAGAISIPLSDLLDENDDPLSAEEISSRYVNLNSYDEILTY
jgi:rhodanese-related sulfurtransferase